MPQESPVGPEPPDALDEIDGQMAHITPEYIESRLRQTLRRAGYAEPSSASESDVAVGEEG